MLSSHWQLEVMMEAFWPTDSQFRPTIQINCAKNVISWESIHLQGCDRCSFKTMMGSRSWESFHLCTSVFHIKLFIMVYIVFTRCIHVYVLAWPTKHIAWCKKVICSCCLQTGQWVTLAAKRLTVPPMLLYRLLPLVVAKNVILLEDQLVLTQICELLGILVLTFCTITEINWHFLFNVWQ